jgi:hypothetical protein
MIICGNQLTNVGRKVRIDIASLSLISRTLLFRSNILYLQFTSTALYKMIQVRTFKAPRINKEHLLEAVGTGGCVRIVGQLLKVSTVDYN